jgi:hypothetical protein
MKQHGRPEDVVTDKLRSYGAQLRELVARTSRSLGRAQQTGRRTPTSPSEGGSGPCCGSDACMHSRSSPPCTLPSTTTSTQNEPSPVARPTSRPAAPLWQWWALCAAEIWRSGDSWSWLALVWQLPEKTAAGLSTGTKASAVEAGAPTSSSPRFVLSAADLVFSRPKGITGERGPAT